MDSASLLDGTPPLVIDTSPELPDNKPSVTEDGQQEEILCSEESEKNHASSGLQENVSSIDQASKNFIESHNHGINDDQLFQGGVDADLSISATPALSNLQKSLLDPSSARQLDHVSSEVACQDQSSFKKINKPSIFECINDSTGSPSKLSSTGLSCDNHIANKSLRSVPELVLQSDQKQPEKSSQPDIIKNIYRCRICMRFSTDVKETLLAHKEKCSFESIFNEAIHFSYLNNTFTCHTCDSTSWALKSKFEEHVVCHITYCPYECLTCKQNFESRQLIESHTITEHSSGDAKCAIRGIKRGRKYVEDVIASGNIVIRGKSIIAKTPKIEIQIRPETCHVPEKDPQWKRLSINSLGLDSLGAEESAAAVPHNIDVALDNSNVHQQTVVLESFKNEMCLTINNVATKSLAESEYASICENNESISSLVQNVHSLSCSTGEASMDVSTCHQNSASNVKTVSNVLSTSSCAGSILKSFAIETLQNSCHSQCLNSSKPHDINFGGKTNISGSLTTVDEVIPHSKEPISVNLLETKPLLVNLFASVTSPYSRTFSRVEPSKLDPAKSEHLNSLFGVLNPATKDIEPTNISTKIQKIAIPPISRSNLIKSSQEQTSNLTNKQPKYNVKTITEYTSSPVLRTITPAISTIASHQQQQQVLLIPFNPIMQVKQSGQNMTPVFSANKIANSTIQHPINSMSIQQHPIRFLQPHNNLQMQQSSANMPLPQPFNLPVFCGQQNKFIIIKDNDCINKNPSTVHQNTLQTLAADNASPQITLHYMPQSVGENSSNSTVLFSNTVTSLASVSNQNQIGIANSQVVQSSKDSSTIVSSTNSSSCQMLKNILKLPPSFQEAAFSGKKKKSNIANEPSVDNTLGVKSTANLEQDLTSQHNSKLKKILFRIKSGQGFVCEYCRKFTRDEFIFRRHVWDHFHGSPMTCKACSADYVAKKDMKGCLLVNNVVCNLIKRSSMTLQEAGIKTVPSKIDDSVVIDITEVENDCNETKQVNKAIDVAEIIVLDDDGDDDAAVQNAESDKSLAHRSSVFSLSNFHSIASMEENPDKTASKFIKDKILNFTDDKSSQKEMDEINLISASVVSKVAFESKCQEVEICNIDDEDDNHVGSYLLDKTLTEEVDNSEKLVSDVVDSSFKVFDPANQGEIEKYVDKTLQGSKTKELKLSNQTVKQTSDKFDFIAHTQQLYDTEVFKKHSTEEFYMCGYERCSFSCSLSLKYREHLHCDRHQQEYNYVCCHCGQKDYTEDSHVRHVLSHANSKVFILYKCPVRFCKYKTNILRIYCKHLSDHKAEELTVKCTYCHKTFPTIESLCEHLKHNLLKFISCPHCSFKFVNRFVVSKHITMFHPDKARLVIVSCQIVCYEREINFYVPPVCITKKIQETCPEVIGPDGNNIDIPALLDKIENSNEAVDSIKDDNTALEPRNVNESVAMEDINVQEMKKVKYINSGLGPKSYKCPHCTYLSCNHIFHMQHVALHGNDAQRDKRFVCNLCPKGADNIPTFKKHLMNHVGKNEMKVFYCTSCSYSTNQKCHIMDHLHDNHDDKSTYIQKVEIVVSNEVSCKHCEFIARSSEQVVLHEKMLHQEQPVVLVEALTILPEAVTNLNREKDKLEESENCSKRQKYHCDYCKEFFKHKVNLKDHLQNDHKDIENKHFVFYKCKYCSLTSTMKPLILSHISKEHEGKQVRILRKIEAIENNVLDYQVGASVSEETKSYAVPDGNLQKQEAIKTNVGKLHENVVHREVQIPDGNIFKQPFTCPICYFSSNLRINVMRHLKEHPEVKPVRQKNTSLAKKSTAKEIKIPTNRQNSLVQDLSGTGRKLLNPFAAVKQMVEQIGKGKSEECIINSALDSPSKDLYILGESHLHSVLSACFLPVDDLKFQCKICHQKIAKKFVLHRHILDHLKIVFFKCKYCEEGAIERTLMVGHIVKEHPSKTLNFIQVSKSELERQLNDKILNKNFNNIVDIYASNKNIVSPAEAIGLVKQPVHELTVIESDDEVEKKIEMLENNQDNDQRVSTVNIKCNKCRYIARNKHLHDMHLEAHDNPFRKFTCSECDYRGDKVAVIKHIYNVFHVKQPTVIEDGELTTEQETDKKVDDSTVVEAISMKPETLDKTDKIDSNSSVRSVNKYVTDSMGKQVKLETLKFTSSGVYELRTLFKCKDCGEKRESKSGMYKHFMSSKCSRPFFQCSLCSFQSPLKTAINKHAVIRHDGKKCKILAMPLAGKIKTLKIPVRHSSAVASEMEKNRDVRVAQSGSSSKSVDKTLSQSSSSLSELHTDSDKISCQLCSNYRTDSAIKLQYHINTVHQGTALHCLKCSYKTPLVKHMMNHCKNVHIQKIALYRNNFNFSISTKSSKHKKDSSFVGLNDCKNASSISNDNEKRVFKCPKCDFSTTGMSTMKLHLHKHFAYKRFHCKYCDEKFNRHDYIKRHLQACHDGTAQKFFTKTDDTIEGKVTKLLQQVKTGGKKLDEKHKTAEKQTKILGQTRPSWLDNYTLVEIGVRNDGNAFYCDICGLKISTLQNVKRHIKNIHHRKRSFEQNSDTVSSPKKFKCQNVGIASNAALEDENLEKSKYSEKYKVVVSLNGKKEFKCTECSYTTKKIKSMRYHNKSHGPRRYHCPYCNFKTFHTSIAFMHVKEIHAGQDITIFNEDTGKIMTCQTRDRSISPISTISLKRSCSSVSSLSSRITDDISSYEVSTIKPKVIKDKPLIYCCNLCPSEIEGKFHFRQHLVTHEEFKQLVTEVDSETKLCCGYCSYVARNDFDLSAHNAFHMSEARYKCPYCEFIQFQYGKVQHHVRFYHSERKEIVIDRKQRNGILLVNLNPSLQLVRVNANAQQKKYRRIVFETDEECSRDSPELESFSVNNMVDISSNNKYESTVLDKQKYVDGNDKIEQTDTSIENKTIENSSESGMLESLDDGKIKEMPNEVLNVTKVLATSDYSPNDIIDPLNVLESQEKCDNIMDSTNAQIEDNVEFSHDFSTSKHKISLKTSDDNFTKTQKFNSESQLFIGSCILEKGGEDVQTNSDCQGKAIEYENVSKSINLSGVENVTKVPATSDYSSSVIIDPLNVLESREDFDKMMECNNLADAKTEDNVPVPEFSHDSCTSILKTSDDNFTETRRFNSESQLIISSCILDNVADEQTNRDCHSKVTDDENVSSSFQSSGVENTSRNVVIEMKENLNAECIEAVNMARVDTDCKERNEYHSGFNSSDLRQVHNSCHNVSLVNTHINSLNDEFCEGHVNSKNVDELSRKAITDVVNMETPSDILDLKNSAGTAGVMDTKGRNADYRSNVESGEMSARYSTNVFEIKFEGKEDTTKTSELFVKGDNVFDIFTCLKDGEDLPHDQDDSDTTDNIFEKFKGDLSNHQSENNYMDDSEASKDGKNIFDTFSKETPVHHYAKADDPIENFYCKESIKKLHGSNNGAVLNEKSNNFCETSIDHRDSEKEIRNQNDNLFDKFTIDDEGKHHDDMLDSDTSGGCKKSQELKEKSKVDYIEVDELIRSIDETVKEGI